MKILGISNNYLGYNNNNGKIMRNYLGIFKDIELCSFYIANEISDGKIESFRITDREAFRYFISLGHYSERKNNKSGGGDTRKNQGPFFHILRYFVWNSGFWKKSGFKRWLINEKPTHISLMYGNNPYLIKLTRKIANEYDLKVSVVMCEDYPFKKYNYYKRIMHRSLSFVLFQHILKRETKKLFDLKPSMLFFTDYIARLYLNHYSFCYHTVIYPQSFLTPLDNYTNNSFVLYGGNLGLGRIDALLEFADELYKYDPNKILKIYGGSCGVDVNKLKNKSNIRYLGVVDNSILIDEYYKADLIIHVEKNNVFNSLDLKYSFSTKIADMIMSGNRMLLYIPESMSLSSYINEYNNAYVVNNKEDIVNKLNFIYSELERPLPIKNKMAKNHSFNMTKKKLKDYYNGAYQINFDD